MQKWSREQLKALDDSDPLAKTRERFHLPKGIYFNGNSLGPASKDAEGAIHQSLDTWRSLAVDGWFQGGQPWLNLADKISAFVAPLIGAHPSEVTIANSTTINLHQFLATLYRPTQSRHRILVDQTVFPSDLYAIRSHLQVRNLDVNEHLLLAPAENGDLSEDELIAQMDNDVCFAVLPSVVYVTGQLLDMERLVREAHQRGIIIGFDCSHSVGCIPHEFDRWQVDFAFWCSYKYLNGGPGAVAGLYLNREHFGCAPGIAGWFGTRKCHILEMPFHLNGAPDAEVLQVSTPFVFSLAPLLGSLSTIAEAGIDTIRAKSLRLTDVLIELIDDRISKDCLTLASPRDPSRRGGHIALAHLQAERLCQLLRERGVILDCRKPDIIRMTPCALYTSFEECLDAVGRMESVLDELIMAEE